jgi:hypothetical protein
MRARVPVPAQTPVVGAPPLELLEVLLPEEPLEVLLPELEVLPEELAVESAVAPESDPRTLFAGVEPEEHAESTQTPAISIEMKAAFSVILEVDCRMFPTPGNVRDIYQPQTSTRAECLVSMRQL